MSDHPSKPPGRNPSDDEPVVIGRAYKRPKSRSERREEQEKLRAEYMASPIVMWAEFARSKGLDPYPKGRNTPSVIWQQQKKDAISSREASELAEAVFGQGHRWNKAVVKTLDDYPKTIDTLYELTKRKMSRLVDIAQKADRHPDYQKLWDDVKPGELQVLANTIETLTRAKHKSLMIEGWDAKLAKQVINEQESITEQLKDDTWTIEVIGKDMSGKELQKRMSDWYDRPVKTDSYISGDENQDPSAPGDSENGE